MFYLHEFGLIAARITHTYDQFFYYRWCNEALAALADHPECTKDYARADFSVAAATLRCVSFAVVDQRALLENLAALASCRPQKRIVVFDLTDLPWPNFRGDQMIACKSAFHEKHYAKASCVAMPQFPRYEFETDVQPASQRKYLAGFKGNCRPKHALVRANLLANVASDDVLIQDAVLTPNHIKILPTGKATEHAPADERSYMDILCNSTFALLPRSCGYALSYRMIECMNLGCIPVVISDGYVLPFSEVLDYETFSVRIPEADVDRLPDILRERKRDADRLQAESLRVYREYFSSTARIISHTLEIASRLQ